MSLELGLEAMETDAYKLELVRRAVAGNTVALTVLLSAANASLRRRLLRKIPWSLHAVVDVDDVLQEAQVAAFLNISQFQPENADCFDRWLATVAVRQLHNAVCKQRALKRV